MVLNPSDRDRKPNARHPGTFTTDRQRLLDSESPPRPSPPTPSSPCASMPRPYGSPRQLYPTGYQATNPTAIPRVQMPDHDPHTTLPVRGLSIPPPIRDMIHQPMLARQWPRPAEASRRMSPHRSLFNLLLPPPRVRGEQAMQPLPFRHHQHLHLRLEPHPAHPLPCNSIVPGRSFGVLR